MRRGRLPCVLNSTEWGRDSHMRRRDARGRRRFEGKRRRRRSAHPEDGLGRGHRLDGVFGVAVGADLVGPGAGRGGAADHHLDVLAQAGDLERLDGLLLVGHRRGKQGGEQEQVAVGLLDLRDEGLDRYVAAHVADREAGGGEHRADDRLADLVDVAGDRAGDIHAEGPAAPAGGVDGGLQDGHGGLHGLGALDQLGEEELALAEEVADLLDAAHEALVEDVAGGQAGVEALLGQGCGLFGLTVDDGLLHQFVELFRHWILLTTTPSASPQARPSLPATRGFRRGKKSVARRGDLWPPPRVTEGYPKGRAIGNLRARGGRSQTRLQDAAGAAALERRGPGGHFTSSPSGPDGPARHLRERVLSLIHISEPTRLGMISYAVFCLKKKNRHTRPRHANATTITQTQGDQRATPT